MGIISLDEVIRAMETGEPFTLTAIELDLNRNKGGKRLVVKDWVLCKPGNSVKSFHYRNNTRNIKNPANDEVRAIHPLLITHFNEQEVGL
jgi:hypothetical protein